MRRLALALAVIAGLTLAGCSSVKRGAPKPAETDVGPKPVTLAAQRIGNVLVVETKWDKYGPYHFIIDTGSSVTLVSPALVSRYEVLDAAPADEPQVRVRSPDGGSVLLQAATLRSLQLGKARFEYTPVLAYDCSDLSSQFGVQIDGILGFPLFRNTLLTLDYPHERVILRSGIPDEGLPGEAILFTNPDKTPLIAIRLEGKEFVALIDSGSSECMDLNPAGLDPRFLTGPLEGPVISTLAGDRVTRVGRLGGIIRLGSYDIPNPVAAVTDELSSIGGGILSHFIVTFDQEHDQAFFQRDSAEGITIPPLRTTGLSFRKTPAYWKVVGVIPGSPAEAARVSVGDLVSRIGGEPVSNWTPKRFDRLNAEAPSVAFTFIDGTRETSKTIPVADLVP